jgi:Putative Flp pilus-assembly TadE/G-like
MFTRSRHRTSWQQTQKGQVLLIFALTAIVLFAIMGLAVDAGISYLHSDQQQKAAAAAALSGVGYLPGDSTDATKEATLTAQRDGYTTGGSGTSAVSITTTTPVDGQTNELEVQITAPAPVYFLELLGFGQHEVTASAVAEYLPPIQLGAPGATLGSTIPQLIAGTGEYFLRSEGWGNPRSEGDPFTPTPNEQANSCGPSDTTCVANPADVHQISCIDGDDLCANDANGSTNTDCGTGSNQLCLNDVGGQNYLITVPAGTYAGVSIYNPSFDPGTDGGCGSQTPSCLDTLHEDDGSFPTLTGINAAGTAPDYDFDSMAYSLYAVPDLNDRAADIPLLQDIFCPFNAYDLDSGTVSYSYYQSGASGNTANGCDPAGSTPTLDTVNGTTPTVYNSLTESTANWIPLTSYSPTGNNANLFYQSYNALSSESAYVAKPSGSSSYYLYGGSSGETYRLRVDTLAWNGAVINTSTSSTTSASCNSGGANSGSLPDQCPLGHNAYAVEADTYTTPGTPCSGCSTSAMADMTIYTPIDGARATSFDVPLFYLPQEYAGKTITVSAFDPGDVGGGDAYIGILQPAYTPTSGPSSPKEYATLANNSNGTPAVNDIGTSLGSGSSTPITVNDGTNPNGYPYTANSAIVETANGSGTAIYNGHWVQFNIVVPSNYNPGAPGSSTYWNLYYQVAGPAYAGDTLAFEVQYLGSPVHLCAQPGCTT